ncbi:hypothetical protein TNCV_2905411 [Trichonephila clavipes]|nr:hypothetical protein TNCV_2905411 [Trichonephila clavipes]
MVIHAIDHINDLYDFALRKIKQDSFSGPLKTRRVEQRCTLNLSRAETSSRSCGVVARRGGCQLTGAVHVT